MFSMFPDMSPFTDPCSSNDCSVTVKAGHAAVFQLPNISSNPEPSVQWQSDPHSLLYGTKYATTSDNRLVILSVDSEDQLRYR